MPFHMPWDDVTGLVSLHRREVTSTVVLYIGPTSGSFFIFENLTQPSMPIAKSAAFGVHIEKLFIHTYTS